MSQNPPPIDPQALNKVLNPISQAQGMPNQAYTDWDTFYYERDHVLGKTWAGIAFASDLPDKNHVHPINFMGLPLVLMSDAAQNIRVFHNVCSHRGMKLIQEAGPIKGRVRCPYHSWTYDLNGSLMSTPHIGGMNQHSTEGFDCKQHGLREVRSHIWMGIVFINLSSEAESFDDFIAPLQQRWNTFTGENGLEQLQVAMDGSHTEIEVNCNWKLAIENYCEAYHLPWVHPALNSYSPLSEHYNIIINDGMSGQGSRNYNLAAVAGTALPQFPNWPQDRLQQAEYISLYPNVMLGLQADHAFTLILDPQKPNHTIEKLQITYIGEAACGDTYASNRDAVLKSWQVVFGEDVFAVEGMQQGRESPGFQGGVFSPVLDEPTHHFHQWVARQYLG